MRRKLVLSLCLAVALGTASCQDQTEPTAATEGAVAQVSAPAGLRLQRGFSLPASAQLRDVDFAALDRVIDPDAYKCRQNTRVGNWFNSQLNRIPKGTLDRLLNEFGAQDVPLVDALFFLPDGSPQEFGYNGEYTTVMQNTHTSVKGFWNIFSPNIRLVAMKGSVLLDVDRVTQIYENFFIEADEDGNPIPVTHERAVLFATQLKELVLQAKSLNGGDHPLFSFNAFAIGSIPPLGIVAKIAMGDGILAGYQAAGLDDVAPQGVYAHEFGHHIQFLNGYISEDIPGQNAETSDAEFTRYTELMADAFATYYLSHQAGGKKEKKRVKDFLQIFFNIGDCAFDNPNHHGTPNQRMAAADFGIDMAARDGGAILTEQQFHDLFVAAYPSLIAPDKK